MCTTFELKLTIERVKLLLLRFSFLDVQYIQRIRTSRALGHFPPKLKDPLFYILLHSMIVEQKRADVS